MEDHNVAVEILNPIFEVRFTVKHSFPTTVYVFLLLAACSNGRPIKPDAAASSARSSATAEMTVTDSSTDKLVFTPTRTLIPSASPIATTVPPLELWDAVFFDQYDGVAVIARIRNNTNKAVFLGGEDTGLEITVESWSISDGFYGDFLRAFLGPVLVKNDRYDYPDTSFVLFPGETGILASSLSCYKQEACRKASEPTWDPPEQLGYTFHYQSQPHPYAGNTTQNALHPEPENVKFVVKDDMVFFHFELPQYNEEDPTPNVLVLLLDAQGAILNSAAGDVYFAEDETSVNVMIKAAAYINQWGDGLTPLVPLTADTLRRLDHLEIFVEYTGMD